MATFTNDLRRGELLPAAQQRELGLSVCCGDKLKSSFRFENGEREHERVFAFRCDTQSPHLSEEAVGEVSLYCGYGTENNEAFPVIYIFSDTDKSMVQAQHIEYMTPKGESIRSEQILGIMVPLERIHEVKECLSVNYPHIKVGGFNWR
ncbi:hypothetical protein ACXWYY_002962 [Enterobacter hormaechei]